MKKRNTSINPGILQNIAFTAVILFGLLMSYAIHYTQRVVAEVQPNRYQSIQTALSDEVASTSATKKY